MISLYPRQVEMIDNFLEIKGIASASEVVRQAIIFYFDSTFPGYIWKLNDKQLTEKELAQKREREQQEALVSMSPEDFTIHNCKGLVRDGMAIFYNIIANESYFVVPLKEIKEWATSYSGWLNEHKQKANKEPMDDAFVAAHLGQTVEFHGNKAVI